MTWQRFFFVAAVGASCFSSIAQVPSPKPGPETNLLAEAARSVGVSRCLPAITRLSSLAIAGAKSHDVLADWDRAKPDAGPFFSLLGINYGGQSVAATITSVPQPDGSCTVSAERISVAPFTCQSIAQVELKGYTATALMPTFTVYTLPSDPGASVSLIDSPPMCLVIRRHVQYSWTPPAQGAAPGSPSISGRPFAPALPATPPRQ
jgi:hypothetical protein